MDPVSLIVSALAAGAGLAVQDGASDAVKGAHARLREAVRQRLVARPDGELALARYEADPPAAMALLAAELVRAGAGDDVGLTAAALAVMELADAAGARDGKYVLEASGAQGVQVGSGNSQVNYFIQEYIDQRRSAEAPSPVVVVPAGRLLAEVRDPFALEVHRPVQPDDPLPGLPGLPDLPAYVPRRHDAKLAAVVRAAAGGSSGIATLVGGSSAGKTRACWEALEPLRQAGGWRLWHPRDPGRPEATLRELPEVGPRTVVWLNEAQEYLSGNDGERVAAGLRTLLADPARAPALVLGTLWPEHHASLTRNPAAQARQLLDGTVIQVPAAFTGADLAALGQAAKADPRLAQAAERAEDGQVTQYLAGAPALIERFRAAPPAAKALILAAMDARRLGAGPALPLAFLEDAAPGYLPGAEWDALGEDWAEQALDYTAVPCKGARGPLTRIRPRPAGSGRNRGGPGPVPAAGTAYRLADYLDQHGRAERAEEMPPREFWTAAAASADGDDQRALGDAARARGLYQDAARLRKNASAHGSARAAQALISTLLALHPDDVRPAQWAADRVDVRNPFEVAHLLEAMRQAGAAEQVNAVASRAADHADLSDLHAVAHLLEAMRQAGAGEQAHTLASRAADHADLSRPRDVARLLDSLRETGAAEQATAVAIRAADHADLSDLGDVAFLLDTMVRAGTAEQATILAAHAADHADLSDPFGAAHLLDSMPQAGAAERVGAVATRAVGQADLSDPVGAARLLNSMQAAGAAEQASALTTRAAGHAGLSIPVRVAVLLDTMQQDGAAEQAAALARRAVDCTDLSDPGDVAALLRSMPQAGRAEQAAALARRAADHAERADLGDPRRAADLLDVMRQVGAAEPATALATRAATDARLSHLSHVARLLDSMREMGATKQVSALATRAAGYVGLSDLFGLAVLLDSMREAGAAEQVTALARRAAHDADLSDPFAAAKLLDSMREAGAAEQAIALARRAAGHADLSDLFGAAVLLDRMREMGAADQVTALARRAADHVCLSDPSAGRAAGRRRLSDSSGVERLADSMREAGAAEQVATLAARMPAAGMFPAFLRLREAQVLFRFGRGIDGTPASPWGWDDLI